MQILTIKIFPPVYSDRRVVPFKTGFPKLGRIAPLGAILVSWGAKICKGAKGGAKIRKGAKRGRF